MAALRATLGLGDGTPDLATLSAWGGVCPGTPVEKTNPLFPRIKVEAAGTEPPDAPPPPEEKPGQEDGAGLISYREFTKTDLRTAKVLVAEKVKGASKLLRLEIMMGQERRQLVAGIAQHYVPDDLDLIRRPFGGYYDINFG